MKCDVARSQPDESTDPPRCPESCRFRHLDIEGLVAGLGAPPRELTGDARTRSIGTSVQAVLDVLAGREPPTPGHLRGRELTDWLVALREHNDFEDERAVAAVAWRYGVTPREAGEAHYTYLAARLR